MKVVGCTRSENTFGILLLVMIYIYISMVEDGPVCHCDIMLVICCLATELKLVIRKFSMCCFEIICWSKN